MVIDSSGELVVAWETGSLSKFRLRIGLTSPGAVHNNDQQRFAAVHHHSEGIMMKRNYNIGDTKVQLNELVSIGAHHSPRKTFAKLTNSVLSNREIRPFVSFGMRFGRKNTKSIPSHRVYRDHNDEIVVGTPRLTVQLDPKLSRTAVIQLMNEHNLTIVSQLGFAKNLFDVRLTNGTDPIDIANKLAATPNIRFAIPEMLHKVKARAAHFSVDDPLFNTQWHLTTIAADQAWSITRGAGVRVAIIDHGFQIDHPDLRSGILIGARFKENGPDSPATFILDKSSIVSDFHGTFCAGMLGARANNHLYGCGVAPECSLCCISIYENLIGSPQTFARAIAYAGSFSSEDVSAAAGIGTHVISCSVTPAGPPIMRPDISLALDFIANKCRGGMGVPLFYAVDDMAVPIKDDPIASDSRVIAVGMSNRVDLLPSNQSAFGPELQFVAPGKGVLGTGSGSSFVSGDGTSFATPCAAGVAALVLAANPKLSLTNLLKSLRDGCDKIGPLSYGAMGRNDKYGFGRINAANSVR